MRSCLCLLLLCCSVAAAEDLAMVLARFSDPRPSIHLPAARTIERIGQRAVPDLGLLATDADAEVRRRVARMMGAIGGAAAVENLRRLLRDQDASVRSEAAIAIGGLQATVALAELHRLLRDQDAGVRDSAALALGMIPDVTSVPALLAALNREGKLEHGNEQAKLRSQRTYKSMITSLNAVVGNRRVVGSLGPLFGQYTGAQQELLLKATWEVGDPRLCLPLVAIATGSDQQAAKLAVISLAANGDSRCLQALTQVASRAGTHELREAAAGTLRVLTGYRAGPGQVWELWWRDNGERVRGLFVRDAFIARCHDPEVTVGPAELAAFSVEELDPLVSACLGHGAVYWPDIALRLILADEPARWRSYLLHRYRIATGERDRVRLLAVMAEVGIDAALAAELQLDLAELRADFQASLKLKELRISSERAMLALLLEDLPLDGG